MGAEIKALFGGDRWLFAVLCLLTFLATVAMGDSVHGNAQRIMALEAVFVAGYLATRQRVWWSGNLFQVKSIRFWVLAAWLVGITLSLINSPYGLMTEWFAVKRYYQTLFHIIFFLCLKDYLASYRRSFSPIFTSLTTSVVVLSGCLVYAWFAFDIPAEDLDAVWLWQTPFNTNIRIVGFLATSAVSVSCAYNISRIDPPNKQVALFAAGVVVWGLLFWCGGRGSFLAVGGVFLFLVASLLLTGRKWIRFLVSTLVVAALGLVLAELFSVFDWNGLLGTASRTASYGAENASNGRMEIWSAVFNSVQEEGAYLLGLGSQGYCYMPTRTFAFQPHNLFIQFYAEWGILGTILFTIMLADGFIAGIRNHIAKKNGTLSMPAMAAGSIIIALGIAGLLDGTFYHGQPSFHLAIAYAVWMLPNRNEA